MPGLNQSIFTLVGSFESNKKVNLFTLDLEMAAGTHKKSKFNDLLLPKIFPAFTLLVLLQLR